MREMTLGGHAVTSVLDELTSGFPTRALSEITGIAVHHDAGFFDGADKNFNGTTVDEEHKRIFAVHRMHVTSNGWEGIAYHLYVFPSGRIWYVGDLRTIRAHVAHQNTHLAGIVLAGDFTTNPPMLGSILGLANAIDAINIECGRPLPYKGHRQWVKPEHLPQWATACPGDTFEKWLHKPREIIAAGLARETAARADAAIFAALAPNLKADRMGVLHDQVRWITGVP